MTLRQTVILAAGGLLMGASAGPQQAESAAPEFPIYIDINYCWGSTSPCPRNYIDGFILFEDGTAKTYTSWPSMSWM